MVIFMPYYRQHGQLFHSQSRSRPSSSSSSTTVSMNSCKFASSILCRFIFSFFLLIIALFLFRLSVENSSNQNEGSIIIAAILLTISIISFIRTCQKIRRYYIVMDTRRRLIQRLRERQQAYDLNNHDNQETIASDLPSYKELFPSHLNINNSGNDPPSYDDFVKKLIIRHPTTSSQSQTNPARCIWITDNTRRSLCLRGTVTYV